MASVRFTLFIKCPKALARLDSVDLDGSVSDKQGMLQLTLGLEQRTPKQRGTLMWGSIAYMRGRTQDLYAFGWI